MGQLDSLSCPVADLLIASCHGGGASGLLRAAAHPVSHHVYDWPFPVLTCWLQAVVQVGQLDACAQQRIHDSMDDASLPPGQSVSRSQALGPASQALAAAAVEVDDEVTLRAADGEPVVNVADEAAAPKAAPYSAPGGKWSNFKKYSFLQVRLPRT